MNLRYEILKACAANPGAPIDEIADAIKHDRQKAAWAVRDCAKAGLLSMRRDDVTGQPGYTLTAEGKQRLAEGPGSKQGSNMKKAGSDSEGGETDVKAQSAEIPPQITPQIPPPQYDPNSAAFSASTDAEQDQLRAHLHLIGVLADIRAAVGDPEGKLMQDELVERVRETARARAIAQVDLDTIRATLRPLVYTYTGDPAHAPGPARCAEHAVQVIQSLSETNREQLAGIVAASETLAPLVPGDIDTSDMDLQEIADRVVAGVADLTARLENKDEELLKQAAVIVDLRNQLGEARAAHHALQESPTLESIEPAGYLVRATKRKPRTLLAEDKAREAALSSIRAGAQRAEVFALVPIGQARRGAAWWPA